MFIPRLMIIHTSLFRNEDAERGSSSFPFAILAICFICLGLFAGCTNDPDPGGSHGDRDFVEPSDGDLTEGEIESDEAITESEEDFDDSDDLNNSDHEETEEEQSSCLPFDGREFTECIDSECPEGFYCLKRNDEVSGLCLPFCTPGTDCFCGLCGDGCPVGAECPCADTQVCSWENYEPFPTCKNSCTGKKHDDHCKENEICLFDNLPYEGNFGITDRCVRRDEPQPCPKGYFQGGVISYPNGCFPGGDGSHCEETCGPGYACENEICVPQCPERCRAGFCNYETAPACYELECNGFPCGPTRPPCCGRERCCKMLVSEDEFFGECFEVDECESGEFLDPYSWE